MRPSSCAQALPDQSLQLHPYRLERHLADNLCGKGIRQQPFGFPRRHSTALCVKERDIVQAPDGGTVRALHVIRKDLQLRLGVDSGGVAQQEIPVGLLCVSLLRFGANENLAVEHCPRMVVEYALIDLPAATVRLIVMDRSVIVDQLVASGEIEAVEQRLHVLVIQTGLEIVTSEGAAHRQREGPIVTVSRLSHERPTYVVGPLAFSLDPGVLHPATRLCDDLGDRIGPVPACRPRADIALDNGSPRATAHEDKAPGLDGAVLSFVSCNKDQMNRILEIGACRDLDKTTVPEACGIQGRERIGLDWSELAEVAIVDRAITQRVGEAAHTEPFGTIANRAELRLIKAVHENYPRPLRMPEEVRLQLLEADPRRCGGFFPGGLCNGRDRGEPPFLIPRSGKAHGIEAICGRTSEPVQPLRTLGHHCGGVNFGRSLVELAHEAATSSSIHSYPRSSSCRASSFPPDLTILPPESTWTRSGTI